MDIPGKQGLGNLVDGLLPVRMDYLQPFPFKTYLLDQSLGVGEPFPSANVPLSVTARSLTTGDKIHHVCPSFYGPQELKRIYPATARQGVKPDP